ncbi:MAG: DUF721 domain-containing protein [Synergistaceae bacterium]|jgi:hypothetical protein|nr:DUF721 domain-containing protein [Synergistaceae bacterium]
MTTIKKSMRRRARAGSAKAVEELLERAIPPNFSERLKLKKAAEGWKGVVGAALGARSIPVDVADGELLVIAETPLVAKRLSMMGGNIARTLEERLGFGVKRVRVVVGKLPLEGAMCSPPAKPSMPKPKEAEVKDLARRCLEVSPSLPEDAAESFAGLRLFFAKRFHK